MPHVFVPAPLSIPQCGHGCSNSRMALTVLQLAVPLVKEGGLEAPPAMRTAMASSYNESQMQAVTAGLSGSPVVLIQGPPGD